MTDIIKTVFVSPDGKQQEGSSFAAPSDMPTAAVDDSPWDLDRTLWEFQAALRSRSSHLAEACMKAMDRHRCWHQAFEQLIDCPPASDATGESVVWFWISYGFHISDALQGDPILALALKALLHPYIGAGYTLYRGEAADRYDRHTYGMSWTTDVQVARMFAARREPPGVVIRLEASPEMILAGPTAAHQKSIEECEYLLDQSAIRGVELVEDYRLRSVASQSRGIS